MNVVELPRPFASADVASAGMSWWDPDAECTVKIARPSDDDTLWREYLAGAERSYRKHGVSAAIDVDAIRDAGDTTIFWTMLDSTGSALGGVRAVGPLTSPDESHAVVEWAGQPSLPQVRKMITDRLPFGVVEMKTAWVTDDRDRNKQLTNSLARAGCQVLAVLGVQFCMATCAHHVLERWQSSGGVVAPVRSTPYPDERYRTKMMWWDRLTVASLAAPNQTGKIVAEMADIRRRLHNTDRHAPVGSYGEMFTETLWDDEVDVLCVGAEGGVLAAGIAAASAGLDVYLGVTEPTDGDTDLVASLSYSGGDRATTKHLGGFDYAFGKGDNALTRWPVRTVEDVVPTPNSRNRGPIEPFFGAALEQWAHQCAAAPSGVLYDRVRDRQMTEMRCSARGEKIEAAVLGSLHLSPDLPAVSLTTWLKSRAATVGLQPDTGVRLSRLIFEDGPVGALLDTPEGVKAVRANENLIIGVGNPVAVRTQPLISGTAPMTARVCLVSKAASRFGELEIVTATGDEHHLLFVDSPEAELELAASGL